MIDTSGLLVTARRGEELSALFVVHIRATFFTLARVPRAVANFEHAPILWIVPVLNVLAIAHIPRAMYLKKPGYAFASSCATLAALALLFASAILPTLCRPASSTRKA